MVPRKVRRSMRLHGCMGQRMRLHGRMGQRMQLHAVAVMHACCCMRMKSCIQRLPCGRMRGCL